MQDLLALIDVYEMQRDEQALEIASFKKKIDCEYLKDDLCVLMAASKDGLLRVRKIVDDLKNFSRVDSQDWQIVDSVSSPLPPGSPTYPR